MKRLKFSDRHWVGPEDFGKPHGSGVLYEYRESLGLVKRFEGLLHAGNFVTGSLYEVTSNGLGIYKAFDGDVTGMATVYREDGSMDYHGPCVNMKPHGTGIGTVAYGSRVLDFAGIRKPMYQRGTLALPRRIYTGELHPQLGLPSGKGTFVTQDKSVDLQGTFEIRDGEIFGIVCGRYQRMLHMKDHSHGTAFETQIDSMSGAVRFDQFSPYLHGDAAIFLSYASGWVKVVGTFRNGSVTENEFDVYATDADDPGLHDPSVLRSGTLLARVHGSQGQLFDDGRLVYSGKVKCSFTSEAFLGCPDGLGTRYVNGKRRFTSIFDDMDGYEDVLTLYDENEKLLWRLEQGSGFWDDTYLDSDREWPILHGVGTVYDTDGLPMYQLRLDQGRLPDAKTILAGLPVHDLNLSDLQATEDPITYQAFHRRRLGLFFNDGKTPVYVTTAVRHFEVQGFLTDPFLGRYYGLRMRKVRFV